MSLWGLLGEAKYGSTSMGIRKFSLFHLNLVPIREPQFQTLRDVSREYWLRQVLTKSFEFPYHGGESLFWVPQNDVLNLVVGVIEKPRERVVHLPPDQGGTEILRKEWQGAYVVIDPAHHEDGQKMSVENDIVGAPQSLIKYLMKYVNSLAERPYEIEARPIFDSNDFRNFLEVNGSLLSYVKFHFVVPNMWDTAGKLDRELKDTGEETGTEELDLTFKSRRGLRGDSKRVIEGVDYASRGAGNVRAKSITGKKYNSDLNPTQTVIQMPEDEVLESTDTWILKFWRQILGRE